MKVCVLTPSYPKNSDDTRVAFVQTYVEKLVPDNDITVITSSAPRGSKRFEVRNGVKIYRFDYFWPRRLQNLTHTKSSGMLESYKQSLLAKIQVPSFLVSFFLRSFKHCKECDVIDAEWLLSGLIALPFKWFYNKPIYCIERDGAIRGFPKWLSRFILRRMDLVNAWGPWEKNKILEIEVNTKITNIKPIVDFDKTKNIENLEELKHELLIKNEKVISFIGRLSDMKDPLTFIRCIPFIVGKKSKIKFLVVGDGHLMKDVQEEIKKLKIEIYVVVMGERKDIGRILACTDIFVATGKISHCYSASILEAMYKKVPCIITKAGFDEEGYKDKEDVYFVENNPKSLAEGILDLLKDKKLMKKLSENGPRYLRDNEFEHETIVKKTNEVYKKLARL